MSVSGALLALFTLLAAPAKEPPLVAFLGDSLTAGLGLPREEAYPAVLGRLLAERGTPIRVVNAGVSGDTSAGGLRRVDWLLKQKPRVLVLALGANDGLRGFPVETTEENLRQVVQKARRAGVKVLLCGMLVPTSHGMDYERRFAGLFRRLARDLQLPLVPFLLEGVAGEPRLNQQDGVHPNAEGQRRVAAVVLPQLLPLLR